MMGGYSNSATHQLFKKRARPEFIQAKFRPADIAVSGCKSRLKRDAL
jgi:hypothetical protein